MGQVVRTLTYMNSGHEPSVYFLELFWMRSATFRYGVSFSFLPGTDDSGDEHEGSQASIHVFLALVNLNRVT